MKEWKQWVSSNRDALYFVLAWLGFCVVGVWFLAQALAGNL